MAGNANFAAFIAKKKGDKDKKGKKGPADEARSKKLKELAGAK